MNDATEPQEQQPQTLQDLADGLLITDEAETIDAPETDEIDNDEPVTLEEPAEADTADAVDDETEAEAETDEDAELYTVTIDGQEQQVTFDELTRGYAGQGYIQEGMRTNAEQRKAIEADTAAMQSEQAALSQQRQHLDALVQTIQATGLKPPTAPDMAMLESDPIGYMREKAEFDRDVQVFSNTMRGLEQQRHTAQAQVDQQRQEQVRVNTEILAKAIPELADAQKAPAMKAKLSETGQSYGFSAEEIGGITDARMVQVLHKAMLYDQSVAKTDTVAKKAATARPVMKPKAQKAQNSAIQTRKQQQERFLQSGSLDDAVALILEQ